MYNIIIFIFCVYHYEGAILENITLFESTITLFESTITHMNFLYDEIINMSISKLNYFSRAFHWREALF